MTLRTLTAIAVASLVVVPAAWTSPAVTVVSKTPLQLRGVSFKPRSTVTVTVTTNDGRIVRELRTGPRGAFSARFTVAVDPCHGAIAATITTPAGYRLSLRLAPRGVCAPMQPADE